MAANKTVIVLAPNGRRQNVKVTLNTTILQILEEVCRKQGYNVDDYDIKHIHRILDPNTIFRFTGLLNNAQLEMVPCTKARCASNVTIVIQPEDGDRIMREFPPNMTLAQALTDVYPDSDLERAVLIYMHREISGREALETTTFELLGLNSGKGILRLRHRDPEQSETQAHVSTLLLPKRVAPVDNSLNDKTCQRVPSPVPHCSKTIDDVTLSMEDMNRENQEELRAETKINTEEDELQMDIKKTEDGNQEMDTSMTEESHSIVFKQKDDTEKDQNISETCMQMQEEMYKIEFLGERNALVFSQAGTRALPRDELPDSFFDLDLYDAKTLMRDAKRRREELEDAPLLTEAQRQLNKDKRTLDQLNKYRRTVIRIQFPDQFVLQALFGPLETIQAIKDFIKNYLDEPTCEFTIYTTPPKHVLNPETRLIDEDLVPSAIVYYSGQSLLKPSIKAKLTDPRAAGIEAVKSRTETMRKEQDLMTKNDRDTVPESKNDHVTPGPSSNKSSSTAQNQNKVPKWFKQAFK